MNEGKLAAREIGSRKFGACPAMTKNFREAGQWEKAGLETCSQMKTINP
jgi:hypothetical protein